MRILALVFCLVAIIAGTACSSTSWCEERCESEFRQELITNFGVPPEQIDCSDGSWVGDCAQCSALMEKRFEVKFNCDWR